MYSEKLKILCATKTTQQITKTTEYKKILIDNTSFLDNIIGITNTTRIYCVLNNVFELPKCVACDSLCYPNKTDAKLGFNTYCTPKCSRKNKTIDKKILNFLQDKDWIYNERIILKKSKELIAKELGVSITPINKWLKFHNIPDIKYNCSNPNIILKLSDPTWLYNQHITLHKTCEQIGLELNSSKSTVSIWLARHGIVANESNSYDRKHTLVSTECNEIIDFIRTFYNGDIQPNKRGLIGSLELDIYIPEFNLAIEYNGVYSHLYRPHESSFSKRKDHTYHLQKTKLCEDVGIQLIHIFSDSWKSKTEIWKSVIRNKMKVSTNITYARKCNVQIIDTHTKNIFLDENHLQGKDKSKFKYGLYYNQELIAVMTFGKCRYSKKHDWELIRFSIKRNYSVVGGFSKLLKHFKSINTGSIISYADRTYSNGNVYSHNGFHLLSTNYPSYYYVKKNSEQRLHRSNFTKSNISGENETRTEEEIMFDNNYYKIFDCGTYTYVLN
jgi:hypothetical protein